jgi:ribosomal protein L37AE/L43A
MSYQGEDPVALLEEQGWRFKRAGREVVTTCPFCDKPEHLYMNGETGAWKCHRCGEAGNLYQLRQRLGLGRQNGIASMREALGTPSKRIPMAQVEEKHRALLGDQEALAYCTQTRAWSLDVVKRMKLGLRVDGRGRWIGFPWLRRGECVGMKYRILPAYQDHYPARFDREPGYESVLYNADAIEKHDEIILASGESDALAMTLGLENVVATTTGESSLPPAAVDVLAKRKRVLVLYDTDGPGQEGARKVGKRIGFDRTWLVQLPAGVKDVNDFLIQGGTRSVFQALLADAVQFDVPSVLTFAQALDRLQTEKETPDWSGVGDDVTPWPSISQMVGRWRGGNLIVVGAPPAIGKTTFVLQIMASWAARGVPALHYSLEQTVEELTLSVLCAHYYLAEGEITSQVIEKARRELADLPLYLGGNPAATGHREIFALLGQAVRRYGLGIVAFDHLNMLARSLEHAVQEVGVLTRSFKLFAMEHQIPVVLIGQPRKLEPGQVMTADDFAWSHTVRSDADRILILHRDTVAAAKGSEAVAAAAAGSTPNFSPITLVRLAKGRRVMERDALLLYVAGQYRFRELAAGDLPASGSAPEPAVAKARGVRQLPLGTTPGGVNDD